MGKFVQRVICFGLGVVLIPLIKDLVAHPSALALMGLVVFVLFLLYIIIEDFD